MENNQTENKFEEFQAIEEVLTGEDLSVAPEKAEASEKQAKNGFNKGGYKRLFSSSWFQKLWFAQFVSGIGDWLIIGILIPTVMALSNGSASAVAGILIAKIIPSLFLSSFVGVLVDYFDRRKIMMWADVVRFVLVLILLTTNSLAAIYLVVLLMETAALFFWPARNAFIPAIVGEDDVPIANGIMYTTQQASMVVGLAASGAILAGFEKIVAVVLRMGFPTWMEPVRAFITPILVGSKAGYALDSLTFLVSLLLILSMRNIVAKPAREDKKKLDAGLVGQGAVESFKFMGTHKELRGLLVTVFFALIGGGALVTVGLDYINTLGGVIPFANQAQWLAKFAGSRQTFILVFLAVGMVVGALAIPRLERIVPVKLLFPLSVAVFAAGMFGFAMASSYFAACLYAIGAGVCISALTVAGNNYIVAEVDDSIRGRVFTALEAVIRVSLLISMIVISPLSDILTTVVERFLLQQGITSFFGIALSGPRITLMFSGLIVACAAVYGFKKLYFVKSLGKDSDGADGRPLDKGAESA